MAGIFRESFCAIAAGPCLSKGVRHHEIPRRSRRRPAFPAAAAVRKALRFVPEGFFGGKSPIRPSKQSRRQGSSEGAGKGAFGLIGQ